ncbi:MAG: glycosyltransferase involved in cell wall biosynthesis [Woeseiaceae bacterium]|jgi:glycosyltransferase involved in cell wall biosynthesis
MRILVLSFYYQPDLCAGSFRCTALVEELKKYSECEIEIISTLPNRYSSFSVDAQKVEKEGNITIHRVELPSHKNGKIDQAMAFFTYYRKVRKIVANEKYDVVYATSSRLFTAFLGAIIANKKCLPLYLDIRDIFVDTIKDVLLPSVALLVKPVLLAVEQYTFRSAQRINLVSRGFEQYFDQRYPEPDYCFYTNGIDREFLDINTMEETDTKQPKILQVTYAGNLGEGQDLHKILPQLAKTLEGRVEFNVIGDGGQKAQLEDELTLNGVTNVKILSPVSRNELIAMYLNSHILFLHLSDSPAFKKVLPSKIFEYAAMGKPIWAGVSGYAANFLNAEVKNVAVFEPGNHEQALQLLNSLDMTLTKRESFVTKYSRENIMTKMAKDLVDFASSEVKL